MKRKITKILIIASVIIAVSLIAAWQAYPYYWRMRSTVDTFSNFTEPDTLSYTDIVWRSGNYGGISTPIGSFFVKVELNGVGPFYMQFDTGASQSSLYGRILNKLQEKHADLARNEDELSSNRFNSANLKIGDITLEAIQLRVLSNMGRNEIDSVFNVIGTIGYDAILGRKLILDFKQDRLAITNKAIEELDFSFEKVGGASLDRYPILVPAEVAGENVKLWYDTGSSMFSLLLGTEKLVDLDDAETIDTLCCISAWGKSYEFYRRKLNGNIKLGQLSEKTPDVYATIIMNQFSHFPNWLMLGITGNQMFIDKVVLVDTENNVFGISD